MADEASDRQAWDRQDGESTPAYEAFVTYRDLGAERSLDAVGGKLGKSGSLVSRWSGRWDWVSRAAAYDAHMEKVGQQSREAETAEKEKLWARRRLARMETQWSDAEKLREKVGAMLKWPLQTTIVERYEDGRVKTIIQPARWNFGTPVAMLRAAGDLEAEALDAAAEEYDGFDPTKATREELREYLAKHGVTLPRVTEIEVRLSDGIDPEAAAAALEAANRVIDGREDPATRYDD
jgi:hypothetical protein